MKTLILFSGGIDSTVALAMALQAGKECICLSFDYDQRHRIELKSAETITRHYKVPHKLIKIDPTVFNGATSFSLVSNAADPIKDRSAKMIAENGIPNTYVPARNTLFLAYAAGQAEIYNADEIIIGANQIDHSAYPDCRPEYFQKFQELLNLATQQATEKKAPQLLTPLVQMTKADIIRLGLKLKAPLHLTFTCYDPIKEMFPCQRCDACTLRREAYHAILYQGQKEQLRRCKAAERKDAATPLVHPLML